MKRRIRLYIVRDPYKKNNWLLKSWNNSVYANGSASEIKKFMNKHKDEYIYQIGGDLLK
jgi:hypothetical protein